MTDRSVAIRIGTSGSAQVKADFASIADSGDASAKKLVASYDRASADIEKAIDRQAQAAARIQAALPSAAQASINRSVGTGYDGSQNATAAQYTALLAQQERQVEAVRAQIDPLYQSQQRYDRELSVANGLLRTGAISETEHAAALAVSERALQQAKNAVDGHSGALGLNRQQSIIAQSAVLRFTDAVIAGRNPLTAMALEAHKGVEVLSFGDGGLAGGFAKVAEFVTPTSIAITAFTAVLAIGAIAWISYEDAMAKLEAIARGAGLALNVTGQELEANAVAAASHGTETVGAARKIESAYVQMGGVSKDVLAGLTVLTADFAAATGTDAKQAQQDLGRAFQDPIKGAEDLASRYGVLTQAQVEQIRQIAEENGLFAAQAKLLDDLGPAFDGAAQHAAGFGAAFQRIKSDISEAWAKLGQFIGGASTAIPIAQQLAKLQQERAEADHTPTSTQYKAQLDAQIADLRNQVRQAQQAPQARSSQLAEQADEAGSGYSGFNQKRELVEAQARIQQALNNPGTVAQYAATGQLSEKRKELEAYTRAIQTFLGPADKKQKIDEDEARLAQARTPEARARAGHDLSIDQARGVVETDAQAQTEAAARGEQARARLDKAADKHAATLAREASSMDADAKAALAAAEAYLQSSSAGADAEARQKAVTDATKAGTDADAQFARQQALNVANAIKEGDKQTAALRDETAARENVLTLLANGTLTAAQMNDALSDEAKLRPLVTAQAQAQGAALDAATRAVKAHTAALDADHAAQERFAATLAKASNDNTIAGLRDQTGFAGNPSDAAKVEIARRQAEREAAEKYRHLAPDSPERTGYVASQVGLTQQQLATSHAQTLGEAANSQRDQNELSTAQIALVGKSVNLQEQVVDRLRAEQSLRAAGVDLSSDQAKKDLDGVVAMDKLKQQAQQAQAAFSELQHTGDQFIDTVLDPQNWSSFGDMGKKILQELEQEMLKLALINPLKNMLLGENNPTLGGGGFLSFLGLGGGSAAGVSAFDGTGVFSSFGHDASGTEDAGGGPTWVAENGPELINLPRGARVTNAADTRRALGAANDGGGSTTHNYFSGNLLTPEFWQRIQDGDDGAATRGTMGGASLSEEKARRRAGRTLGSRR